MHDLELHLVVTGQRLGRLLQREQLLGADVLLVVRERQARAGLPRACVGVAPRRTGADGAMRRSERPESTRPPPSRETTGTTASASTRRLWAFTSRTPSTSRRRCRPPAARARSRRSPRGVGVDVAAQVVVRRRAPTYVVTTPPRAARARGSAACRRRSCRARARDDQRPAASTSSAAASRGRHCDHHAHGHRGERDAQRDAGVLAGAARRPTPRGEQQRGGDHHDDGGGEAHRTKRCTLRPSYAPMRR